MLQPGFFISIKGNGYHELNELVGMIACQAAESGAVRYCQAALQSKQKQLAGNCSAVFLKKWKPDTP